MINLSGFFSTGLFTYLFVILFQGPAFAGSMQEATAIQNDTLVYEDIIRGERLFHGLVYLENKAQKCSGCHSTFAASSIDSVNWNPNALDISLKYLDRSVEDLGRVLNNPSGVKMSQAHSNFKFSDAEIVQLKGFMESFPDKGLKEQKPVITNLALFIIALVFFLISLTDLVVTKKLKRQWINLAVLSATSIYIIYVLVVNAILIGRSPGYSPDQPIKFSHAVHAGQNKTDCIYCHNFAPYSKVSGITQSNVCMNCHLIVRNGTRSGMFEIAKVVSSFEDKEPIRWIQVHNLPDHVYYNHSQHVNAGGIECTKCHGPVETMDRIGQYSDLSMGWCINCHRTEQVNFNENEFYSQYKLLSEKVLKGELDKVVVEAQGGNECMRCHY
ncbi:MAG TPA: cytochrome c3 family protein [Bacteroidales bacterium]|nr:cytochrome c3 family protein [Bacteroidales bacterium]